MAGDTSTTTSNLSTSEKTIIYPGFQLPVAADWTSDDILYKVNILEGDRIAGTCFGKKPFHLDNLYQPIIPTQYYRGAEGLPIPAFEVTGGIITENLGSAAVLEDVKIKSLAPETITINSSYVLDMLHNRTTFGLLKQHEYDMRPGLMIYRPYYLLLYYVLDMQKFVDEDKTAEAHQFRLLLDFLEPFITAYCRPARVLIGDNQAMNPCTGFANLWFHFAPGTEVYIRSSDGGRAAGALVRNCFYEEDDFVVELWTIVIHSKLEMNTRKHKIRSFQGIHLIRDLQYCPVHFMDNYDGGKTRAACLRSARRWLDLLSLGFPEKHYCGPMAWSNRFHKSTERGHYDGPVVVDHNANTISDLAELRELINDLVPHTLSGFREQAFNSSPLLDDMWWNDGEVSKQTILSKLDFVSQHMSERTALIFEHRTVAFGIKNKKWMLIDADRLSSLKRKEDPLKNVIIPEDDIMLIKALSFQPSENSQKWGVDFVDGKGIGKIVLLHGPPGVGKTYTVECIAEAFKVPLLSLTMANVTLEEKFVERDMKVWFLLAARWGAVLLLDEADVFLERRHPTDLERNAIVAGLLRHIEYYTGLLFLTTNRVGHIDDAFASRIHVVIGYSRINRTSRQKIWNAFFEKVDKERAGQVRIGSLARKYVMHDPEVESLEWNGREIRNALQTVIALAEYEASQDKVGPSNETVIVEEGHFRRYMRMSKAYRNYTNKVQKQDEAHRAHLRKERYDWDD